MKFAYLFLFGVLMGCSPAPQSSDELNAKPEADTNQLTDPYLIVLGTAQDGGSPHIGCEKKCCKSLFENSDSKRMVVSFGIVDPQTNSCWMLEATPDFSQQLFDLQHATQPKSELKGIFLTHAHIGHYSGLIYLGREAKGADSTPVYAMPRMKGFLETNGPWSQLVDLGNIKLMPLENEGQVVLNERINIRPFLVPHRDEFSETVGYAIEGPSTRVIFIPDIDKWHKWEHDIREVVKQADLLFLDATFYDQSEIPHRDMSEIPHPFIVESMALFETLPPSDRAKVHFIHFNHGNPVWNLESEATKTVESKGFRLARKGMKIQL